MEGMAAWQRKYITLSRRPLETIILMAHKNEEVLGEARCDLQTATLERLSGRLPHGDVPGQASCVPSSAAGTPVPMLWALTWAGMPWCHQSRLSPLSAQEQGWELLPCLCLL